MSRNHAENRPEISPKYKTNQMFWVGVLESAVITIKIALKIPFERASFQFDWAKNSMIVMGLE